MGRLVKSCIISDTAFFLNAVKPIMDSPGN
jgi:hypothetical protein